LRNNSSKWLFIWLLVVDSVLSVSTTLIGQSVTLGFDPIFANPILIAAVALVFTVIESYLPFFILYKFVFEVIVRKTQKIRPSTVCWLLFIALLLVSLSVEVLSFGRNQDPIDVLIPVGLSTINVAVFFQRRVRTPRTPSNATSS
jgi:hypothetical protein